MVVVVGIMVKSWEGSLCLCVVLACVQWKEAGDRKREDILCSKWFQVTQACCPQPQKLRLQISRTPLPLISGWRGSSYIFGGFVNEAEIKMSPASSFSHVLIQKSVDHQNSADKKLILCFLSLDFS